LLLAISAVILLTLGSFGNDDKSSGHCTWVSEHISQDMLRNPCTVYSG